MTNLFQAAFTAGVKLYFKHFHAPANRDRVKKQLSVGAGRQEWTGRTVGKAAAVVTNRRAATWHNLVPHVLPPRALPSGQLRERPSKRNLNWQALR